MRNYGLRSKTLRSLEGGGWERRERLVTVGDPCFEYWLGVQKTGDDRSSDSGADGASSFRYFGF